MPEKFENTALFLQVGLLPTLICHKRRAFQKCSSNWRNLETPALCFENNDITITMWFLFFRLLHARLVSFTDSKKWSHDEEFHDHVMNESFLREGASQFVGEFVGEFRTFYNQSINFYFYNFEFYNLKDYTTRIYNSKYVTEKGLADAKSIKFITFASNLLLLRNLR